MTNKPFESYEKSGARLYSIIGVFIVLFLVLISGFVWRQLILGSKYERQEKLQSLRRIIQPGPRGNIYDRNGKLLVGNRPVFYAAIYLGEIREEFKQEYFLRIRRARDRGENIDRERFRSETRAMIVQRYLNQVNRILGRSDKVDLNALERHFKQRILLPMPLINDLSAEEYARLVDQLSVESPIQVLTDSSRYYPYGATASHLLGYVAASEEVPDEDLPGNDLTTFSFKGKTGRAGIERRFNDHLQGLCGGEIWLVDPVGFQYERVVQKNSEQGKPLTLSIDLNLQVVAEQAMGNHYGAAILIDIKKGEILAIVSKPDYDLNRLTPFIPTAVYKEINEDGAWINRALQGLYPPASPFKLITSIALLRNKVVDPSDIVIGGPTYQVGNRIFRENNRTGHGPVDMKKALQVSCNVYFYDLSLKLGATHLVNEARRFGFDEPIDFELSTTKRILVADPDWKLSKIGEPWRPGDTVNMSVGQGFLRITPMHMACFAAALAKRQTRFQPSVLLDGQKNFPQKEMPALDLSDDDYATIIEGMRLSADIGSSRYVRVPGVNIAAKTGTGQIRQNGKKLTTPWVMGFAPIEDPQIAFVVLVEGRVDDSLWGGTTAGPIAHNILAHYFKNQ
ncbi:MAG: peptidoglycan glycosyltransferase [Verrucomicrobia bacterium CG_4_10_14_0_8_um_filter_43_34]|nr:MAG: peptidoglycan glycosyltransferase [Verrucomicrobia bacterium CG_4_10_14_0_8_um_filter_43_34]